MLIVRLKPIDVEFMRRLHSKVNLIPVIAKADTLTEDEVTLFKQRVSFGVLHWEPKLIFRFLLISNITEFESSLLRSMRWKMKRLFKRTRRSS